MSDRREAEATPPGEGKAIGRGDVAAALACALVGLLLAILPHLIWWSKIGEPTWISDNDDLLYLSVAGRAYFEHPLTLSDPTRVEGGPTMYPWSQFVPAIVIARGLGLGPAAVLLIWRAWAGLSLGLGWYLVIRSNVGRTRAAAALATLMLADNGSISGRLLIGPFWYAAQLLTGRADRLMLTTPVLGDVPILGGIPGVCPHLRIITPGLSLSFLLFYLWLLARARARPSWPRIVAAGVGFGVLFHVYFYYWTAAGLALVLALLFDAGRRRVYFFTGAIGGLVGLPAILAGAAIKRGYPGDWLERSDNFVPVSRFGHLLIPKMTIGLLVLAGVWLLWARRRDLIYLWCLAASGLILTDHQIVTGLEIQNMHWQWFVSGPILSLLLVLLAADAAARWPRWPRALVAVLLVLWGADLAIGFGLRAHEATQNRLCTEIMTDYRRYREQRLAPKADVLAPNSVVAGDRRFLALAAVLEDQRPLIHYASIFSTATKNDEWYERMALNAYLLGLDRAAFEVQQRKALDSSDWGPWTRDRAAWQRSLDSRLSAYDRVAADSGVAIGRLGVRYLALPAGSPPPPHPEAWTQLERGGAWNLWQARR